MAAFEGDRISNPPQNEPTFFELIHQDHANTPLNRREAIKEIAFDPLIGAGLLFLAGGGATIWAENSSGSDEKDSGEVVGVTEAAVGAVLITKGFLSFRSRGHRLDHPSNS